MEIKLEGEALKAGPLPTEPPTLEELGALHAAIAASIAQGKAKSLALDISGAKGSNHAIAALALAVAALCKSAKISFSLSGEADAAFMSSLEKMGVETDGSYNPKSVKEQQPQSIFISAGDAACKVAADMKKLVGFVGETAMAFSYFLRHPGKLDMRETLFYMDKSGADAIPIVVLVCILMGMILGFQGVMQLGVFGLNEYIATLVSVAIVRELGPLMVGMICIGRAGSAYAAELGTMKGSEEIDALTTMGLKPVRMLVVPKIIALIAAMPFLTLLGDLAGIAGGCSVATAMTDLSVEQYNQMTISSLVPANILESLVKSVVFAFIIAAVGCFRGFEADRDAKGVGTATTSSVVTGIFLLVLADFFVTFSFPQAMALIGVNY